MTNKEYFFFIYVFILCMCENPRFNEKYKRLKENREIYNIYIYIYMKKEQNINQNKQERYPRTD